MKKKIQCEGYRRRGGVFTLGPVSWSQCSNQATVQLTVTQERQTKTFPACEVCWKEALHSSAIKIKKAVPV